MHIAEVKYFNTCAYETFFIKRYNFIIKEIPLSNFFKFVKLVFIRFSSTNFYLIYEWLKTNPFNGIKVFTKVCTCLMQSSLVKLCNRDNVESCYRLDSVVSILYLIIYNSTNNNILINRSKLRNPRLDVFIWNHITQNK